MRKLRPSSAVNLRQPCAFRQTASGALRVSPSLSPSPYASGTLHLIGQSRQRRLPVTAQCGGNVTTAAGEPRDPGSVLEKRTPAVSSQVSRTGCGRGKQTGLFLKAYNTSAGKSENQISILPRLP